MTEQDLIHPDVHRLVQLFAALPDVKFPDVDVPMLQALVAQLKERHLAVTQAELELEAARRALDEEQEVLLKKAHRLHAWLTVLAEGDEALQAKLTPLSLPRLRRAATKSGPLAEASAEEAAPKRRTRAKKSAPSSEALFSEAAS